MPGRIFAFAPDPPAAVIRHPPNWTAICAFGALSALHFGLATTAFARHDWEAGLSGGFGIVFGLIALFYYLFTHEISIYTHRQELGVSRSLGPVAFERLIPFSRVQCVQVTLPGLQRQHECCVTIYTDHRAIELPASPTPRQDALALAILLGVRLEKIYTETVPEPTKRIDHLLNEDAKRDE